MMKKFIELMAEKHILEKKSKNYVDFKNVDFENEPNNISKKKMHDF